MEKDIKIRFAAPDDTEALLEIYAPYIKNTAVTFEYTVPSVNEFAERIEKIIPRYPYLIAESGGKAVGYAYANTFIPRAACDHSVEVSIYVARSEKGKGIGKKLYCELEKILAMQNVINVNACIACTDNEDEYLNNNSSEFHKHMGYSPVGRFDKCGYKFGRWYDLIWMEKMIGEHGGKYAGFIPLEALKI